MYPEWPESAAEAVPLPLCPGPTLQPFDFKGWQDIEFLEHLGEGLHAHVFKVRILGKIYALKLFRFVLDSDWPNAVDEDHPETFSAFYHHAEPFNAECRAFGRLQESGHEDLALRCFGYLLLDDKNERALLDKFPGELAGGFNGNIIFRTRKTYVGGFWKKAASCPRFEDLRATGLRRGLRDVVNLQQLGITCIDVASRQLIGGKFCDFSMAVTVPHFVTTPELNPRLTPEMKALLELETFRASFNDFLAFDHMIEKWNMEHESQPIPNSVRVFPAGPGGPTRYNLRKTPSRTPLYSLIGPRRLTGRFSAVKKPSAVTKSPSRKGRARQKAKSPGSAALKPRTRLAVKPPRWYYECSKDVAETLKDSTSYGGWLSWKLEDGLIVPVKGESYPTFSERHE